MLSPRNVVMEQTASDSVDRVVTKEDLRQQCNPSRWSAGPSN